MHSGRVKLAHPRTGVMFDSPVPPGSGWPGDPATSADRGGRDAGARRVDGGGGQNRRGARRGGVGVPRVPAAGRVARRGRGRQAQVVRRPAVLGSADSGLGLGAAADGHRRVGARRARRQPHRPRVHRRPVGRLSVRGAASRRTGQPSGVRRRRGWVGAQRHSGGRGGALCAARQCADTGRTRDVRTVAGRRVAADRFRRAGDRRARRVRVAGCAADDPVRWRRGRNARAAVRARRDGDAR